MLAEDIARRPYSKAGHRRTLRDALRQRSDGSVEFKHQNVSAVLKGLGEAWITGYKSAFNFQSSLEDAVLRWLEGNRGWLVRTPALPSTQGLQDAAQIWVGPAPTLSNQPPPKELDQMLRIARKYDVAGRDARNRRWDGRERSGSCDTNGRSCGPRDGRTLHGRCAGCRMSMATVRDMTSQASRRRGGHA